MKACNVPENQTSRRVLLIACVIALALAFTVSVPQPAHAEPVPSNIEVPAGNTAFLEGHAVGTQNYICLPSGWAFFGPQATLFDDDDEQVITHFLSPNPDESDTARATWQHSQDTSTVWAMAIASYSNRGFVARGDIPLLLLQVVGAQDGPTGGHTLTATTFIQRLNTSGGLAPSTGCTLPTDVGKKAFVPYTADYVFYKEHRRRGQRRLGSLHNCYGRDRSAQTVRGHLPVVWKNWGRILPVVLESGDDQPAVGHGGHRRNALGAGRTAASQSRIRAAARPGCRRTPP